MEPKFQSSFIPKGPIATAGTVSRISRESGRSVLGTLSVFIFSAAILLSLGVIGYEFYLKSSISSMGSQLATAEASLEPQTIEKISNLDSRLVATKDLLENHIIVTPLFDYLENSTQKTVRFTQFNYQTTEKGLEISMRGQARGYSAIALQSKTFGNDGSPFKEPIFADLDLDDKGNVTFSFRAIVDPSVVSYRKGISELEIEESFIEAEPEPVAPAGTSTAPEI